MVRLKNGSVYRGTISEHVAGDHVSMVTLTGEARTFPESSVAYEGPESADPLSSGASSTASGASSVQPPSASLGAPPWLSGESGATLVPESKRAEIIQELESQIQHLDAIQQRIEQSDPAGTSPAWQVPRAVLSEVRATFKQTLEQLSHKGPLTAYDLWKTREQFVGMMNKLKSLESPSSMAGGLPSSALPPSSGPALPGAPGEGASPFASVQVRFRSEEALEIMAAPSELQPFSTITATNEDPSEYVRLCHTPCTAKLPTHTFWFGARREDGATILADSPITLLQDSRVMVDYESHSGARIAGWSMAGVGLLLQGIGIPLAFAFHPSQPSKPVNVPLFVATFGLGVSLVGVGSFLAITNDDHVTFSVDGPSRSSSLPLAPGNLGDASLGSAPPGTALTLTF